MEWSSVDCLNLIAAYQQHPVLWNPLHCMFSNKEKKQDAWKTIGRLFGCPPSDIRKKIESLLRSYRREKTKARKTIPNENGSQEVYVSNWYAYNKLSFLDDKVETRNSQSSTDVEMNDSYNFDDQSQTKEENKQDSVIDALWAVEAVYEPEPTTLEEPDLVQGLGRPVEPVDRKKIVGQWNKLKLLKEPKPKSPSKSSAKRAVNLEDPLNNEAPNTLDGTSKNHSFMDNRGVDRQPVRNKWDYHAVCGQHVGNKQDNYAVYGQHIGNKLRGYDKRTKAIVEYHINNVLFQADMGQFESRVFERSLKFNTFR